MKRKRAVSLLLALALVLGMAVVASPPPAYAAQVTDGFGFNTTPPSDFNASDGKNPYGQGRVALNPLREVAVMGAGLPPAVYDANGSSGKAAVTNWQDVITKGDRERQWRWQEIFPCGPEDGGLRPQRHRQGRPCGLHRPYRPERR